MLLVLTGSVAAALSAPTAPALIHCLTLEPSVFPMLSVVA